MWIVICDHYLGIFVNKTYFGPFSSHQKAVQWVDRNIPKLSRQIIKLEEPDDHEIEKTEEVADDNGPVTDRPDYLLGRP